MKETGNKAWVQNLAYIETIYAEYRRDLRSVPAEWREYFATSANRAADGGPQPGPSFKPRSVFNPVEAVASGRTVLALDARAVSLT